MVNSSETSGISSNRRRLRGIGQRDIDRVKATLILANIRIYREEPKIIDLESSASELASLIHLGIITRPGETKL